MTLNQAPALASQCGYALTVKKKSTYKQVKTNHLCLYNILGFQNTVFITIPFDIWYTICTPDQQTQFCLFLSRMAWTCSFPTHRRAALTTAISERWTLPTSSDKLDHSAAWNTRVRGRKRAEKWKVTPFTGGYTVYLEGEEHMVLFFPGSVFVGFSLSHVEHKESSSRHQISPLSK